jgi:hypothetical protein
VPVVNRSFALKEGAACLMLAASFGCGSTPAPDRAAVVAPASAQVSIEPIATASVEPSAAPSTAVVSAAPDPRRACRGERLLLEEVMKSCLTDAQADRVPEALQPEIAGPAEVRAGDRVDLEVQLVNRSAEAVSVALRISCGPSMSAQGADNRAVVEHETRDGSSVLTSCTAPGTVVGVTFAPGGVLVMPASWQAIGELHRDGKLVKRAPLRPGPYKLHAFTWLIRGEGKEADRTGRADVAVSAERTIVVR